ncbi:hypothetical protein ENSA5_66270 [Enhygromyxa salina]|uniref:Uncharacterized protein n=1 Tax=Enhygromyxa salina TaxID=215803 RepID=A0A2S9XBM6_9BACT|nr:hypothetical protein ENSA5_66270 [Enhygromyxa salina]
MRGDAVGLVAQPGVVRGVGPSSQEQIHAEAREAIGLAQGDDVSIPGHERVIGDVAQARELGGPAELRDVGPRQDPSEQRREQLAEEAGQGRRAAPVVGQVDDLALPLGGAQGHGAGKDLGVGAPEPIDRLLGIPDEEHLGGGLVGPAQLGEAIDDLGLERVDVLVLVDEHVTVATAQVDLGARIIEQRVGQELEVVVAQDRALAQARAPVAAGEGRERDPAGEVLGLAAAERGLGIGQHRPLAPGREHPVAVADLLQRRRDRGAEFGARAGRDQLVDVGGDLLELGLG